MIRAMSFRGVDATSVCTLKQSTSTLCRSSLPPPPETIGRTTGLRLGRGQARIRGTELDHLHHVLARQRLRERGQPRPQRRWLALQRLWRLLDEPAQVGVGKQPAERGRAALQRLRIRPHAASVYCSLRQCSAGLVGEAVPQPEARKAL